MLPLLLKIFTVSYSFTKYQHDFKKDFDMCPPKTFCLVWQLKSINKVTCSGRLSLSDAGSAGVFWLWNIKYVKCDNYLRSQFYMIIDNEMIEPEANCIF